ncbi:MAG: zinc metalloprotease HtpX [Nitrososphaerota archaeon]|nr:zinc metalloprotease HtpX [Candidatus Bathyarchaeota archaeon]MDW8049155.1 zinc metalloprotease HtpX [Nitrososphaerota archaeon]
MNTLKLKASMVLSLALIIGFSTLFLTIILSLLGADLITLGLFVVFINVFQWLIGPYIIEAMYRVKKVSRSEEPELYEMVEKASLRSGIKPPQIMLAQIPLPNAFAYGSPLTGNRIAVTTGLLNTLDMDEVEAVIGHEIGHLKHRDVQVMMFVSILPALFYYVGYSLMWSSMYYGGRNSRERGNGSLLALIGFASIALYWVLTLFTFWFSRLREYYADRHSASVVDGGAQKLSEALAKIVYSTERIKMHYGGTYNLGSLSSFKALFISDPDSSGKDLHMLSRMGFGKSDRELVAYYLNRGVTVAEKIAELFSTHPNIVERLKALQEMA